MVETDKLVNFQLYNITIMRKIYILIIALLLLVPGSVVFAQEGGELSVKAQVRPRYEYNHGGILPLGENDNPISFISNRARLSLAYDHGFLFVLIEAGWSLFYCLRRRLLPHVEHGSHCLLYDGAVLHDKLFQRTSRLLLNLATGVPGSTGWLCSDTNLRVDRKHEMLQVMSQNNCHYRKPAKGIHHLNTRIISWKFFLCYLASNSFITNIAKTRNGLAHGSYNKSLPDASVTCMLGTSALFERDYPNESVTCSLS